MATEEDVRKRAAFRRDYPGDDTLAAAKRLRRCSEIWALGVLLGPIGAGACGNAQTGAHDDGKTTVGAGTSATGAGGLDATSASDTTSSGATGVGGATGIGGSTMGGSTGGASTGASTGGASDTGGASTGASTGGASGTGGAGGIGGVAGNGSDPASNAGGSAGTGGTEASCEGEAVRCNPDSGMREQCASGAWLEQDFVCATSVIVEDGDGSACAMKADGNYDCWDFGGGDFFTGEKPVPPGPLLSVAPLAYSVAVWLLEDGTFVDDTGSEFENVVHFDTRSSDICLLTADGVATCTASGPISASPATQVALSSNLRCLLLEDGTVFCDNRGDQSITLSGPYSAIAVASPFVCGIDGAGAIECTTVFSLSTETTNPIEGSFTKLAMADNTVCGITDAGPIGCAPLVGSGPYEQPGTFTEIAGGDHVICALQVNGSVSCWLGGAPITLPDGW